MQYTKVLCHFDDPNNPLKNEVVGGVIIKGKSNYRTDYKFGKGSVYLNEFAWTSSYVGIVIVENSTPIFSTTDNTTIEFFTKWVSAGCNWSGYINTVYNSDLFSGLITFGGTIGNNDKSGGSVNNTNILSTTSFSHVAFVYNNSTKKLSQYINGNRTYERSLTTNPFSTNYLAISANNSNHCYIDELRISSCIRYTGSTITVPTQPFVLGLGVEYPDNLDGTYTTAPNKLKYYYKVTFQSSTITETRNVVNYETCQKLRLLMYLYKILIISIFLKTLKIRVVS